MVTPYIDQGSEAEKLHIAFSITRTDQSLYTSKNACSTVDTKYRFKHKETSVFAHFYWFFFHLTSQWVYHHLSVWEQKDIFKQLMTDTGN